MKLIDYSIVFGLILMAFFTINDVKIKALNENQMNQIILNNNMDEIVVDGLNAGFLGLKENGEYEVDLKIMSNTIFEEMSLLFYESIDMKSLVWEYINVLLYVEDDGYYTFVDGVWSEKEYFETESHSEKVEIISNLIDESTKGMYLPAYNDGETYKNTIDDNTLIIVYCGYNFKSSKLDLKTGYMSAACIKEVK
ncbi:MAG: hypothetical protein J6L69_02240 [Lachnospiraceae bacterium]|nr:hypothetical protein [Lachnospiraceae bacterium]